MNTFETILPDILAYFNESRIKAAGLRKRFISIGGTVLLTYSSDILEHSLFKAFEHLEITGTDAEAAFTIFACDSDILDCALPGYGWLTDISKNKEEIVTYNSEDIHVLYNPKSGIFSMFDNGNNRGYYYLPKAGQLPFYEKAAPMRMLLHWWCEKSGLALVHAAAIGGDTAGILLAGRSGTGKSTTAIMAARNGFKFLGDDYIVLENKSGPVVHSAYNSVKFRWEMLERVPAAGDLSLNNQKDEKGYFYLRDHQPDALRRSLPLKAVLLPVISGNQKSYFDRVPQSKGLMGLAASSIFQMPGSGKQTLKTLAAILQGIPVYQMSLGKDNAEIMDALKRFMAAGEIEGGE
ncbi:MAG: hypothetical protein K9K37_03270 [Desulfocapsa sp.]|nr:hypothetical protein [Desulfocapsa sp.]